MPKKAKRGKKARDGDKKAYTRGDLWIAPAFSFKRTVLQSDWKPHGVEPSESNRFLELADIALGLSTTERRKRKATA